MYAIIETGSKQYRVEKGDVIDVELLDVKDEKKIAFNNVLFCKTEAETKVGAPHVDGAVVYGELMQHVRGPKVISFKYKKRKNYRRKKGHRQDYLRVKITEIKG